MISSIFIRNNKFRHFCYSAHTISVNQNFGDKLTNKLSEMDDNQTFSQDNESKKGDKDQESIRSSIKPDPEYHMGM